MPKRINFPIDFVISWVDENDSKWISKKINIKRQMMKQDFGIMAL